MAKEIGKVTHFFDKIGVGVFELKSALKVGDQVKIEAKGEEDFFEQTIESMQIEAESVKKAKKGDSIGVKLDAVPKRGGKVFKS